MRVVMILVLPLIACTDPSGRDAVAFDCGADWRDLGALDAQAGRGRGALAERLALCGFPPDAQQASDWSQGAVAAQPLGLPAQPLQQVCSTELAYRLGRAGEPVPASCGGEAFTSAYLRGRDDRVQVRPSLGLGLGIGNNGLRTGASIGVELF